MDFFADHDVLVIPSAPLSPFPVEWTAPSSIEGTPMRTYVDWISITFMITLTACPVVALPCGLSGEALPVGIQPSAVPARKGCCWLSLRPSSGPSSIAEQLPIDPRDGSQPTN